MDDRDHHRRRRRVADPHREEGRHRHEAEHQPANFTVSQSSFFGLFCTYSLEYLVEIVVKKS